MIGWSHQSCVFRKVLGISKVGAIVHACVQKPAALTHVRVQELTARTQAAALLSQGSADPRVPVYI